MAGLKKILVLGSSGRVGKLLRLHLEKISDINVFFHCRNYKSDGKTRHHNLITCDLSNEKEVIKTFAPPNMQFDVVIGLAGMVDKITDSLDYNLKVTRNSLHVCDLVKASRFLFFSSSAVYGPGIAMHEFDILKPTSPYGEAKIACEFLLKSHKRDIEISCLRVANIAGADALMSKFVEPASRHNIVTLSIFPNGKGPARSYITPKSLTEVLVSLIRKKSQLPFLLNVATIKRIEMRDCLLKLNSAWENITDIDDENQVITLDCQRLLNLCPNLEVNMSPTDFMNQFKFYLKTYRESIEFV